MSHYHDYFLDYSMARNKVGLVSFRPDDAAH